MLLLLFLQMLFDKKVNGRFGNLCVQTRLSIYKLTIDSCKVYPKKLFISSTFEIIVVFLVFV